jgi:hypothetical protein
MASLAQEGSHLTGCNAGLVPFDDASDFAPDRFDNFDPGTGDLVLLVVGHAGDVICGDVRVADSEPLRSVRRKDRPDSAGP